MDFNDEWVINRWSNGDADLFFALRKCCLYLLNFNDFMLSTPTIIDIR